MADLLVNHGLRDEFRMDRLELRATPSPAHRCALCALTPMSHGVLPLAGSLLAFLALVFFCR